MIQVMTSIRIGLHRVIAALLLVVQVASYGLAPYAEARSSAGSHAVPTVEGRHGDDCVVVHRPDNCLACQLLSPQSGPPLATTLVPLLPGSSSHAVALVAGAPHQARLTAPHDSRGPPPLPTA